MQLFAQLSQRALTLLEIRAGGAQTAANFLFVARVRAERFIGRPQSGFELGKLGGRALQLSAHAAGDRISLAPLFLRALAARSRVAQSLLGDRDLSAKLLGALALIGNQPRELGPSRFSGGSLAQSGVARRLRVSEALFLGGHFSPQQRDSLLEPHQLAAPRVHLARCVRDLEREAARRQLGVALRPLSLARQRSNLALHLGDEIVDARQVGRRFLQTPLGAPLAVAVETDAGRFLEQLAPLIRFIGKQRVHHLPLDDDAGVGSESGAAHHVVDVAQAAGSVVEEVIALARAAQPPRDHDFAERNVERSVVVLEMERDFGDVHGAARGRALEDHLFHLRAAEGAGALLAEHPAHGVGDVGLSAAVRADDRGHARLEDHLGLIGERLESVNLELRQTH